MDHQLSDADRWPTSRHKSCYQRNTRGTISMALGMSDMRLRSYHITVSQWNNTKGWFLCTGICVMRQQDPMVIYKIFHNIWGQRVSLFQWIFVYFRYIMKYKGKLDLWYAIRPRSKRVREGKYIIFQVRTKAIQCIFNVFRYLTKYKGNMRAASMWHYWPERVY